MLRQSPRLVAPYQLLSGCPVGSSLELKWVCAQGDVTVLSTSLTALVPSDTQPSQNMQSTCCLHLQLPTSSEDVPHILPLDSLPFSTVLGVMKLFV